MCLFIYCLAPNCCCVGIVVDAADFVDDAAVDGVVDAAAAGGADMHRDSHYMMGFDSTYRRHHRRR